MEMNQSARSLNAVRVERVLSLLSGGALLSYGLFNRKPTRLPLAIVGGGLVFHAVRGNRVNLPEEWMGEKGVPTSTSVPYGHGICIEEAVTIAKSPEELYRFWRDLENLPRFMSHLKSVRVIDNTRSHWVARAPVGMQVEWDAEIINDIPNELIGWRSIASSDIPNAGSVHFTPAPGGRGTHVKVELEYSPPGGAIGAAFAKLFGNEPSQTVSQDLLHLKQLMEAGEIATVAGQPHGSRNVLGRFTGTRAREYQSSRDVSHGIEVMGL